MKKLIAISVVFALVLGAAFAQPSLGGNFKAGTKLIGGQSGNEIDEVKLFAGDTFVDSAGVNVNFGDANAGGKFVLFHNPKEGVPGYQPLFAFVWWRPIPQVRLQMGRNADGDWGHGDIAGWGFDAEAKSTGVAISQYNDTPPLSKFAADNGAWGPGFNKLGIALSLYPIDGLQINLGIPYEGDKRASDIYSNMFLDAKFVLEDIGTIKLSAQFTPGNSNRYVPGSKEVDGEIAPVTHWRGSNAEAHDPMKIWAGFYLSAIEGLGVELGLGATLPYTTQDVKFVDNPGSLSKAKTNVGGVGFGGMPVNATKNTPLNIGLGVQYGAGDLNIKARAAFSLAGSVTVDKSRNDAIKAEKEAVTAGNSTAHFDGLPLDIASDTFYVKRTTKQYDPYYEGTGAKPIVDVVEWVPQSGTQEKKADPFKWSLNVAPSYKLGDITVILNLGIGMEHYAKQEVRVVKQVLKTYDDGTSAYVNVYDKTFADGSYDSINGKLVYEVITFEGKPGAPRYKGGNQSGAIKSQSAENAIMNDADVIKADIDWFINPYVRIPAGGGQFYAGFKLFAKSDDRNPARYVYNKANADDGIAGDVVYADSGKIKLNWSIPIGFNFYF